MPSRGACPHFEHPAVIAKILTRSRRARPSTTTSSGHGPRLIPTGLFSSDPRVHPVQPLSRPSPLALARPRGRNAPNHSRSGEEGHQNAPIPGGGPVYLTAHEPSSTVPLVKRALRISIPSQSVCPQGPAGCSSVRLRYNPRMELGDLATWFGAVGAVGALIAAVIAAIQVKRLLQIEWERDRLAEMDRQRTAAERKRDQASRVTAWLSLRETPDKFQSVFLVLVARNASELPVYSVQFKVIDESGAELISEMLSVLPPADSPIELPQAAIPTQRFVADPASLQTLTVQLSFVDSSGVPWIRGEAGTLKELSAATERPRLTGARPALPSVE